MGLLLPWLPGAVPADTLTAAMSGLTARVLCLPGAGEPQTGSGFILDDGTHLVTNWHVVACTQEGGQARVLLDAAARESVAATVRGHDEDRDLAVLRLARTLPRPDTRFATLATLAQRDPEVVVGFPADADELGGLAALSTATLTEGVVGRLLPATGPADVPLVQVSAAINPGNSGGPLFDEAGRVVGVIIFKSLAAVAALGPGGEIALQRVVLGEGLGWAVASDALLPLLERSGIPYRVSQRRLWALERWWHREPGLVSALGLLGLLLVAILTQLATQRGLARAQEGLSRVQEGFTRAARRKTSRTGPAPHTPSATHPAPAPVPAAPPAPQPILRCLTGPYAGQTLPLAGRPVAIGRNPSLVQLVLPADQSAISQRHAVVGHDAAQGGFYVEDCWTTNGVFLAAGPGRPGDAARIQAGQPQSLAPGARFYLATPAISFEVDYQ